MKNVKSITLKDGEKIGLDYLQQCLLGLWELRAKWIDTWGFPYEDFNIDYDHSDGDLRMTVGDWLELRFCGDEQMFLVHRCWDVTRWRRIGKFDEDAVDAMAEDYMEGQTNQSDLADRFDERLHELDFIHESTVLEQEIFVDKSIGSFEVRIEGRGYKGQGAGMDDDLKEMFAGFAG